MTREPFQAATKAVGRVPREESCTREVPVVPETKAAACGPMMTMNLGAEEKERVLVVEPSPV